MHDKTNAFVNVGGRRFEIRNPDKILFPDSGVTKAELCSYYTKVSSRMLPFLRGRALMMERFPDGIETEGFFQKQIPDYFPTWISRARIKKKNGFVVHPVVEECEDLCYIASQACIVFHIALAPVTNPGRPDRLVFDLDPSGPDFGGVRKAALALREKLLSLGLYAFCKTTGSRGLHVEVPLDGCSDFSRTRAFARAVALGIVEAYPEDMTLSLSKSARGSRVFIDYLRNGYSQTTVCPYSVRARIGAPVAAPVSWQEVEDAGLKPDQYNIRNVLQRMEAIDDPWENFHKSSRPLPEIPEPKGPV